jgi:hypothetical protein
MNKIGRKVNNGEFLMTNGPRAKGECARNVDSRIRVPGVQMSMYVVVLSEESEEEKQWNAKEGIGRQGARVESERGYGILIPNSPTAGFRCRGGVPAVCSVRSTVSASNLDSTPSLRGESRRKAREGQ